MSKSKLDEAYETLGPALHVLIQETKKLKGGNLALGKWDTARQEIKKRMEAQRSRDESM
jgi:hypothetical protein